MFFNLPSLGLFIHDDSLILVGTAYGPGTGVFVHACQNMDCVEATSGTLTIAYASLSVMAMHARMEVIGTLEQGQICFLSCVLVQASLPDAVHGLSAISPERSSV